MRTLEEIRKLVLEGTARYNDTAAPAKRIVRVDLSGSFAVGCATSESDIDLLVGFAAPNVGLFALTAVLESMEAATGMPVDVVQTPLLADSLLDIERPVPPYAAA